MSKKPVYDVLDRLLHKEWHTELQSEQSEFAFDGYFGDYDLTITSNEGETTHKLHLGKFGKREFIIEVK